jgi:hypothetical protein
MVHAHTDRKSTIVYNFTRSFNGNGKAGTVFDGFGINGEWERRYHTAATKDWDGVFAFFFAPIPTTHRVNRYFIVWLERMRY